MSRIFGTQLDLGDSTFPMSFLFAKTILMELKAVRGQDYAQKVVLCCFLLVGGDWR